MQVKVGDRFNRLVVVEVSSQTIAKFRCDCGTETWLDAYRVRTGNTKSCGCIKREAAERNAKRKQEIAERKQRRTGRRGGRTASPLYQTWRAMHERCLYRDDYKAAGRKVCPEWDDFAAFEAYATEHLGSKPRGYSIDRIDNRRGYEPGNVRWSSPKGQVRNRTRTLSVTAHGQTKPLATWAEKLGVDYTTLFQRLKRGMSPEEIVRPLKQQISLTFKGRTQSLKAWATELGLSYELLFHRFKKGWAPEAILSTDKWVRQ